MLDSYKQSIDKNQIPPGLMDSTAEKMRQAMEIPAVDEPAYTDSVPSRRTSRKIWSRAVLAAAAVFIVVLIFPFAGQSVIVTPMNAGEHQETVELKDGILYFGVPESQRIDISHNFGLSSSTNEWSISDYRDYLGLDVLPGDEIDGYEMIDQTVSIQTNINGDVATDKLTREYIGKNDETFTLTISKSASIENAEDSMSVISGIPVLVNKGTSQNEYRGEFNADGITYTIESNDMTQEDFILLLYHLVKE